MKVGAAIPRGSFEKRGPSSFLPSSLQTRAWSILGSPELVGRIYGMSLPASTILRYPVPVYCQKSEASKPRSPDNSSKPCPINLKPSATLNAEPYTLIYAKTPDREPKSSGRSNGTKSISARRQAIKHANTSRAYQCTTGV